MRRMRDPFTMAVMALATTALAAVLAMAQSAPTSLPATASQPATTPVDPVKAAKQAALRDALKAYPHQIVYQASVNRKRELRRMNADGSARVKLSKETPDGELYPHCSADGSKICFVSIQGQKDERRNNIYVMDADGGGERTLVAKNAFDPCWNRDGTAIAYMPGEFDRWTDADYASKGLAFYAVKTAQTRMHANKDLHHLYVPCWSPDGKWIVATVHGGMGYDHAILAIQADGEKVCQLKGINGCRPDISPDDKKLAWNRTDQAIGLADLDLTGDTPIVSNVRSVVTCDKEHMVYHADWSPDGKYIAFDYGPSDKLPKGLSRRVDICVADAAETDVWVPITDDVSSSEPDWLRFDAKKDK